jgi:DNA-binding transcriptional LysR family regulator
VELHITEGGSRFLVEALNESALDLALVVTRGVDPTVPGTELIPLLAEELVVVSATGSAMPESSH